MAKDTLSRSLHDVGLAAWFGGTLANAVALNPAAAEADTANGSGRVANSGWNKWTPVNAAAIGAHLAGSVGELVGNRSRLAVQRGAGSTALTKTALTVAALAVTGYSRLLGRRVAAQPAVPVLAGTEPAASTPDDVSKAQKQLSVLQWIVPALTGALIVVTSLAGEQQRASEVKKGFVARFTG
ncbi:hypothetical protein Ait01nite_082610 [Actinoplanes italicus]|uniref:ABC-type Mn/Zn transport systems, ATPase component n=1 Tax=Actinoplanes italicus TaxID=113567 RepID=A0A2T0K2Y0_9ACTN|nr:hypothetical protein [Actinoplanes italicus]PRX17226.1 hypothetical protein CLV67_1162 [Actinoplanes italicus]GIE35216.1 hypothetical protein Ait01nite_082610 [Actinoplanes italicus]